MMTDQELRTLAYSKSPKTSKRTTFQDELQAAVSFRASKTKAEQYSNYKNSDDEDDFLNKLLNSRKKRIDAFKAGKSKAKFNTFDLSEDEEKLSRPKKVSFLKSQRNGSDSKDKPDSEPPETEPSESFTDGRDDNNGSFPSQHSTNVSEENAQFKKIHMEPADSQMTREASSLSYQTSDDNLPLPLPSDGSVEEAAGLEKKRNSVVGETAETAQLAASPPNNTISPESVAGKEPPVPKPRQRTLGIRSHISEKPAEETESQDLNRPQTSSASVSFSTDTSSNIAARRSSPQCIDSSGFNKSSSKSEQSQVFTKSTFDSGSRDGLLSDDSRELERNYSSSFEEFNACSGDPSDQLSHAPEKSFRTTTSCSHSVTSDRPQSVSSKKVESKYLGTLKVLDRKVSLQESQLPAADSLRAAVYQEWLKKKREKSRQNSQVKKKEEILKEKGKKEQEAKKEDAIASYEAWKEKKAEYLRAKAKEVNERISKEQQATEEKQEKRLSAKQVFEKWKQEHDHLLREKYRKQKEAEHKLQLQKQEREEERRRSSKTAFSDWCEKKKDVLHEKLKKEREQIETKAEEEQYMKEEKEKVALEMYENWLTRKDLEQKRRREERRIQAIIGDSPPPPWSPPNKTIPFRK